MPNLEEIFNQLQAIDGGTNFLKNKEIKELPNVLTAGERIEAIAKGRYSKQPGLIIATDKRVILIFKILFNSKIEDFPYEKITSVQYEKKSFLKLGEITILGFGNTAVIDNMDNKHAQVISDFIRNKVISAKTPESNQAAPTNNDVLSQLERLGKLKEQNLITDEEFGEQKKKLLG
ncbi:PH domain-containing protein [Paenibacillus sp. FA6]|uniref:PH domain-containing protein n=1 Tax=Paenibacillus sp. FA6 TaxID=3413029 RepID=UPI003F6578EB